ncbi:MAG TPA: hypothetical protein VEK11_19560 [Thermoanaerobaculia bacterium]|jgi:hypothetical protein|nr:hypothetical protein [Thermoanaerobaculia bacterium]
MGQGYRIDVFNNTSRTLSISPGASGSMNANGLPSHQLQPGQWLGTFNNPANQPYYVELGGETGFITIDVDVTNVGSGSFVLQFDADSLQNYPGSAFFTLPNGVSPIKVTDGSTTSWIYATVYLAIFGPWTEAVVVLVEAFGAQGAIVPPYQV